MFSNSTVKSTINQLNGNSFDDLAGFGIYSSSNTVYYYLMHYGADKIYILNDEWKFVSFKTFTGPVNMISIGNSLYMTGNSNVWKLDQYLNILINYKPSRFPKYRGISYNSSSGLIYVAASWVLFLKGIQVFSSDLTLIRSLSTSPHYPFSITFSSNQLYVGTTKGMILVYQNEKIINQFNGCDGNSATLTFILFDPNGYMATSCGNPTNKLYLFSPDGSLARKSLTTPNRPYYIGFDSKGRFIQISDNQINIYN